MEIPHDDVISRSWFDDFHTLCIEPDDHDHRLHQDVPGNLPEASRLCSTRNEPPAAQDRIETADELQ
jgi:hypothetical protein